MQNGGVESNDAIDGLNVSLDDIDLGNSAVWTVSSSKLGFGVQQLRDSCTDTYWQYACDSQFNSNSVSLTRFRSDGAQPHFINLQFPHKVSLTVQFSRRINLEPSHFPRTVEDRDLLRLQIGRKLHTQSNLTPYRLRFPRSSSWCLSFSHLITKS